MDIDDAVPPPIERIRRSPRALLEHPKALDGFRFGDYSLDEEDPPTQRRQSSSPDSGPPPQHRPRTTSSASINPLAAHPVIPETAVGTNFSRLWASQSFEEPPQVVPDSDTTAPLLAPPIPRRSPARLKSYRPIGRNKRLPPHLRRRTSLETIDSVTTTPSTASEDDEENDQLPDPPEAAAPSPWFFTVDDDPAITPVPISPNSQASSICSSSLSPRPSSNLAVPPLNSMESAPKSPKSLFSKLKHCKLSGPSGVPDRQVINRQESFDRNSHRSSLSGSNPSGSNVSLPSEQPFDFGLFDVARSRSGSSSEWSASSFDITTLTEAEIKKCKKKGINPALYAEMKAARKGRWASPIAGNVFL